jgi:zinc protease
LSRRGATSLAGARIHEHRLRNDLEVLVVERHDAPVVSVLLHYRVGARNEREHEAGLSHFLEHMMFKGSERFGKGQVDVVTTVLGGTNNAWTSHDHTAYWFEFASDRWEQALAVEADRMRGLLLDPAEFEAEKAVVLEELSMNEDDPWRELSEEVAEAVFPGHPYGRPVIGYAETLRGMTPELMRAYHDRWYTPANAVLVICGDVTDAAAMRAVRRHLGALGAPPGGVEPVPTRRALVEPKAEKRLVCRWDDDARRLCMGWPTAAFGTDEDYALDLITVVLASGRRSRLYARLVRDEGLATSVSVTNDTRIEGGAMWLYAECAEGVEPWRLEAAIDEELERLQRRLVTRRELTRARAMLLATEAHDHETVTDLAEDVGSFAVDGDWRLALATEARLDAVTPAFMRETARRYLTRRRRVTGWSLPEGVEVGGPRP